MNEQRKGDSDIKKKISEEGGRRGVKELEMVSRKFGKGQYKSKFANEAKKVLEEEEKDELLIEELEEADDASISYHGMRESRQRTVRSKGRRYEKEATSESEEGAGEFE